MAKKLKKETAKLSKKEKAAVGAISAGMMPIGLYEEAYKHAKGATTGFRNRAAVHASRAKGWSVNAGRSKMTRDVGSLHQVHKLSGSVRGPLHSNSLVADLGNAHAMAEIHHHTVNVPKAAAVGAAAVGASVGGHYVYKHRKDLAKKIQHGYDHARGKF